MRWLPALTARAECSTRRGPRGLPCALYFRIHVLTKFTEWCSLKRDKGPTTATADERRMGVVIYGVWSYGDHGHHECTRQKKDKTVVSNLLRKTLAIPKLRDPCFCCKPCVASGEPQNYRCLWRYFAKLASAKIEFSPSPIAA